MRKLGIVLAAAFGALVVAAVFFLVPLLPGRPSARNFEKLREGMAPVQVEHFMGGRAQITTGSGPGNDGKVWYEWNDGRDDYIVTFQNGVLLRKDYVRLRDPG